MIRVVLNCLVLATSAIVLWCSAGLAQSVQLDNVDTHAYRIFNNDDSVKSSVKSPTGAMIRSLVFPGWGQFYNKKYFKAVLAFGTELGLLANSIYLNQKCQASTTEQEQLYYINNRNLSNWWLVGMILISMADAFVDAHLSVFDESSELSDLGIMPFGISDQIGIKLSVGINF